MRFETQNAASYLVWNLHNSHTVKQIRDDGSDIILLDLQAGQSVLIHLYERAISLTELADTLRDNHQQGIHTLFIFWADLLLPRHDSLYHMDDWMAAFVDMQGGYLYAFEVAGRQAYFFPVFFEGSGKTRKVRYGETVNFHSLHAFTAHSDAPPLVGSWRFAGFGTATRDENLSEVIDMTPLQQAFAALGLDDDVTLDKVKQAYRDLARTHHPDLQNEETDDFAMKRINLAYEQILNFFKNRK